jgi:DNA polymerase elongation subunit (family B)
MRSKIFGTLIDLGQKRSNFYGYILCKVLKGFINKEPGKLIGRRNMVAKQLATVQSSEEGAHVLC